MKREELALTPVSLNRPGRMISGSKSGYRQHYPGNLVVFNANVCREDGSKLWHGDLDLDRDEDGLRAMSVEAGCSLLVLSEHDARFQHETAPRLDRALARITHEGVERLQR